MLTCLLAFASTAGIADGFTGRVIPSRRSSGTIDANGATGGPLYNSATRVGRRSGTTTSMTVSEGAESSTQTFDVDSWMKGYQTAHSEDQYLLEPSMGSIPKDIEGTFLRNGPAKFEVGKDLVMHPFDGDGMVSAITFSEEGAYFRNRFVKTTGYQKELKAGKKLYRGMSNLPGGPLANAFNIKTKNLANTNVIYWGGQVLALWEGGLPYRLDAKSLDTLGETMLGETINENRKAFAAHPRIDVKKERLVGFGSHNMQETVVYEYDKKFNLLGSRVLTEVKGFLHDMGVSDNYHVFLSSPVTLKPLKWILGLLPMSSALTWEGDTRGAVIHVVPRDPSKPTKTIPIPACFCFHIANAYEDSNTGEVIVDLVRSDSLVLDTGAAVSDRPVWEESDFGKDVPITSMQRYRLEVASEAGSAVDISTVYDKYVELPIVNPRVSCQEHRYVWAQCGAEENSVPCPGQGVVKLDVLEGKHEKWVAESHEFIGEPTFIPRKGASADVAEDSGYIATMLVNGRDQLTEVVILDAANVAKGPICRLPLKGFIPHTLHGVFVPELVFTPEQIEKSFALTDLFARKGWNEAKSEFSGLGLNSFVD